ncbi:ChaN family lipoprotein [Pseudomonas sp. PSKL.D1]|uniref:ChaN family lipoprotein n=1 Tax=Pseudomonas sp. PSKL.D1 TaxID=3029060 RepID=UPI00238173FA|nr:ChaN family lipoprotein [Pseudomonas sp. PSKL.D1]WDY58716.1 ChaN family lipoprotein [Pseudomonas sp. PSKL.D1]
MRHPRLCGPLLCLLLMLGGCQASLPPLPEWQSTEGRDNAELGQIHDLASGQVISPEQLVERLTVAQQVLVGEKHDNPDHHALQLWLLRALQAHRKQGSLLLEMLQPEQQARVDALQAKAQLPHDLPKALAWQAGWDWQLYGPIVREALQTHVPLLAANLSTDEMRQVYRQPKPLPGAHSNAPAVKDALLQQVKDGHCGLLPDSQLPAMLAVQQQRDRRMAESMLAAPEPALLLTGAYHARKDLGVPLHLHDLGVKGVSKVLILAEVGDTVEAGAADFVWYTAAMPEQDYCAQLLK